MKELSKYLLLLFLTISISFITACKKDPCDNKTCENNGICREGICECTEGFYGSTCVDQIFPSKITIESVIISEYPLAVGGYTWDIGSDPDPYFILKKGSNTIYTSNYSSNQNYSINVLGINFQINDISTEYTVQLFDHDDIDPDDFMESISFDIYNSTNKFPKVLAITNPSTGTKYEFYLKYSF